MDENQASSGFHTSGHQACAQNGLHSVARALLIAECFSRHSVYDLGAICLPPLPVLDVPRSRYLDANRPVKLAQTIADMALRYVVITSLTVMTARWQCQPAFADCITAIRGKARDRN